MIAEFAFALLMADSPSSAAVRDIQQSHIEANVPPSADFDRILRRDLEAYFRPQLSGSATLAYEMLRDGPTQSGVAYPKFYVWVRVSRDRKVVVEGALRTAAIDRTRFEVTDFSTVEAIHLNTNALYAVFPAAVCEKIKAKASGETK